MTNIQYKWCLKNLLIRSLNIKAPMLKKIVNLEW